uniref:Calcineurin-like phosphoesterase domain-containing protein 1 n=1 Tax=Lygus hesperus TaxID=30085 RepID=A0A146KLR1_LYGHE
MADVYKADNKRIDDPIKLHQENDGSVEPFTFVVGADPQFGLIARYIEKRQPVDWAKEIALFKGCIEKINKLEPKPKFFAIMGDMCDSPPIGGEEFETRKKQEEDFFSVVGNLDEDIALVTVSGNHDVHDVPTPSSIERYRNSWGKDFFDFVVGGVHFIVINSQYYVNSSEVSCLATEQEEWLDNRLLQPKRSAIGPVIFMHTPPFVSDPDEPDTYFSLVKAQREKLLDRFVQAGVKYVFCGHLHKNGGGKYKDLEVITTTAIGGQLGPDKSGFRVVSVLPGKGNLDVTFHTIQDS